MYKCVGQILVGEREHMHCYGEYVGTLGVTSPNSAETSRRVPRRKDEL